MVVLFNAGAHVPLIPLVEVVGNGFNAVPEQIGATGLNAGVTFWFTVMVNVAEVAHCPAVGVNVYVVVDVLFNAGDHVPLIPLVEVVGSGLNTSPEHIGETWLKVGAVFKFTLMVNVAEFAHCPDVGVNV